MVPENEKDAYLDVLNSNWDPEYAPHALKLLFDENEEVKRRAFQLLLMDPLFAFESRRRGESPAEDYGVPPSGGEPNYLSTLFDRKRVDMLSHLISKVPEERFKDTLLYLSMLPGVYNLNQKILFGAERAQYAETLDSMYRENWDSKYPAQITVVPTYSCNLSCVYCFNRNVDDEQDRDMDLESFVQLLDRAKSEKVIPRINLFGGEPTIYPQIPAIVAEIKKRNLQYYFATNGIVPPEKFNAVISPENLESVTFHIIEDSEYTESQLGSLLANIDNCAKLGIPVIFRYNLTTPTVGDWDFLVKYFGHVNVFGFSFAVAFPASDKNNQFAGLEDLEQYRDKIVSLILYVVEHAKDKEISIVFAKPFPLCLFNNHELKIIMRYTTVKNVCEVDKNSFTNNICINPDLTYYPCMSLTSPEYRFDNFQDVQSIPDSYYEVTRKATETPLLKMCESCVLHHAGVCQAACYAYLC